MGKRRASPDLTDDTSVNRVLKQKVNRRQMLKTAIQTGVIALPAGVLASKALGKPKPGEELQINGETVRTITVAEARALLNQLSDEEAAARACMVAAFDAQNPNVSLAMTLKIAH